MNLFSVFGLRIVILKSEENFFVDIGSKEPVSLRSALFHFVFLLVISLLCIGILPGLFFLLFENDETMTAESRKKGLINCTQI